MRILRAAPLCSCTGIYQPTTLGLINQANHFNVGKHDRPGRIVDDDEDGLWPELISQPLCSPNHRPATHSTIHPSHPGSMACHFQIQFQQQEEWEKEQKYLRSDSVFRHHFHGWLLVDEEGEGGCMPAESNGCQRLEP